MLYLASTNKIKKNNMKYSLILVFITLLTLTSCEDDNPTQSPITIEDQINAERPIKYVYVNNPPSGNWSFSKGGQNELNDAYAEDGYLIVISVSKHYFNLSLANEIMISKNYVSVTY